MANERIRKALKAAGVRQWELANVMGISEATIYRTLRTELPEDDTKKMLELIEKLSAEREKRG